MSNKQVLPNGREFIVEPHFSGNCYEFSSTRGRLEVMPAGLGRRTPGKRRHESPRPSPHYNDSSHACYKYEIDRSGSIYVDPEVRIYELEMMAAHGQGTADANWIDGLQVSNLLAAIQFWKRSSLVRMKLSGGAIFVNGRLWEEHMSAQEEMQKRGHLIVWQEACGKYELGDPRVFHWPVLDFRPNVAREEEFVSKERSDILFQRAKAEANHLGIRDLPMPQGHAPGMVNPSHKPPAMVWPMANFQAVEKLTPSSRPPHAEIQPVSRPQAARWMPQAPRQRLPMPIPVPSTPAASPQPPLSTSPIAGRQHDAEGLAEFVNYGTWRAQRVISLWLEYMEAAYPLAPCHTDPLPPSPTGSLAPIGTPRDTAALI